MGFGFLGEGAPLEACSRLEELSCAARVRHHWELVGLGPNSAISKRVARSATGSAVFGLMAGLYREGLKNEGPGFRDFHCFPSARFGN